MDENKGIVRQVRILDDLAFSFCVTAFEIIVRPVHCLRCRHTCRLASRLGFLRHIQRWSTNFLFYVYPIAFCVMIHLLLLIPLLSQHHKYSRLGWVVVSAFVLSCMAKYSIFSANEWVDVILGYQQEWANWCSLPLTSREPRWLFHGGAGPANCGNRFGLGTGYDADTLGNCKVLILCLLWNLVGWGLPWQRVLRCGFCGASSDVILTGRRHYQIGIE